MGGTSSQSKPPARGRTRYFSPTGCVVEYPDHRAVFVGGSLIGQFTSDDKAMRNMLIVAAARGAGVHLAKLAEAFGVSVVTARTVRRRFEQGGLPAITKPGGKPRKLTPKLVERLSKLFEQGLTIDEAYARIRKRVSRTIVGRAHKLWVDEKKARERQAAEQAKPSEQLSLDYPTVKKSSERRKRSAKSTPPPEPTSESSNGDGDGAGELGLERAVARGGEYVQHVGAWLLLAMMNASGLYAYAEVLRTVSDKLTPKGKRFITAAALRVAIDAVSIALIAGHSCIEGVRRIATPSAPTLLRHRRAPSANWTRRVLRRFAKTSADALHMALATALVRESEQRGSQYVVYYIDNHGRPYTGKNTIRKVWRMQDKRARPGASDYWVHDEDGRPVMRMHSPEHASLVQCLRPIGESLRGALAEQRHRVLLVFDRAGAREQCMADLRDADFDFVTYEIKPYASLPVSAFDRWIQIGTERYEFTEAQQKNLGKSRGRVRRIAVLSPEGEQFNIVAVSEAPAEELILCLLARWARQENQFKYAVERWGINHLDDRDVEEYPPDAVIPNPARNRIDRALRIARATEGEALRKLERLTADDPKRRSLEDEVERARAEQEQLESMRPHVPKKAPLRDTELAGKLVRHRTPYKLLVDTLRIALANAESELAARLAPHLPRGEEVKKTLANLTAAPGTVRINNRSVVVTLAPAGTARERSAFDTLLAQVNALSLTLPGDPARRTLRFRSTEE